MKIIIAILALVLVTGLSFAAEQQKTPKATEPIGAVIETTGVFVGKIIGAAEEATTGEKKVTVRSETGETRVFPFNETVELVDKGFHALTFNQLKPGEDVTVKIKKAMK